MPGYDYYARPEPRRGESDIGILDPASIDLDLAMRMTQGWSFDEDPPPRPDLRVRCMPKVVDFDELGEPDGIPEGYHSEPPDDRDVTIHITCFDRSIVWNSTHYFMDIKFYGIRVYKDGSDYDVYMDPLKPERQLYPPFGKYCSLTVDRPTTEDDIKYGDGDWTGFHPGDMIHRWTTAQNAFECGKRIIELRFRNYGKIRLCDDTGDIGDKDEC